MNYDDIQNLMDHLDRAVPPHSRAVSGSEDDPLVAAAQQLAQGPAVRLSDAALNRIEAQLRQAASVRRPVRHSDSARRSSWNVNRVLRYAAAACLIIVLSVTGVTGVSADSLPGDQLYPVKRTVEGVRLALASDNSEPGLRVGFAERRLDEFQALLVERHKLYPRALEEATAELNRALDLLAAGHGDRRELDPRIRTLAQQQARLVDRAVPLINSFNQSQQLQTVADENHAIQQRLLDEGSIPGYVPDPTAAPIPTPVPTPTPTPTATPTATPTYTPTPTMTPTGTLTPDALKESSGGKKPKRTPPGHGATPGLGHNPPGHGGSNPGVGNDGNPPGRDKGK